MKPKQSLTVVAVFLTTMAIFSVFAQKKYRQENSQILASYSDKKSIANADSQGIDELSWVFLISPEAAEHTTLFSNFDAADKALVVLLSHFSEIKKLPPAEQVVQFQKKMSLETRALCSEPLRQAQGCQSSRILAMMLHIIPDAGDISQALPFFKFLKEFDSLKDPQNQIALLEKTKADPSLSLSARQILRIAQSRLLIRIGDFKAASSLLQSSSHKIPAKTSELETILAREDSRSLCQAEALSRCDNSALPVCHDDIFWANWNKGCGTHSPITDEDKGVHQVTILASWWNALLQRQPAILNKWDAVKTKGAVELTQNKYEGQFAESVKSAMDLVIAIKSNEPHELLERSQKLNPKNPLWVWAQKTALEELGPQWVALTHPHERQLMGHYGLLQKTAPRAVASDKNQKPQ